MRVVRAINECDDEPGGGGHLGFQLAYAARTKEASPRGQASGSTAPVYQSGRGAPSDLPSQLWGLSLGARARWPAHW